MPVYVKQKDSHSCGPISIINALKWLGIKATLDLLPKLKEKCKTSEKGTEIWELIQTMNWARKKFKLSTHSIGLFHPLTMKSVERAIDQGHAVVLAASWHHPIYKIRENHAFLILKKYKEGELKLRKSQSPDRFWVANGPGYLYSEKSTLSTISKSYLRWICSNKKHGLPAGWILRR